MTSVKVTKTMDSDKPKNCEPYKKGLLFWIKIKTILELFQKEKSEVNM